MLDIKLIRNQPEMVRERLARRGPGATHSLDELLLLDERRREILVQVEEKRSLRNTVSEEIGRAKKAGEDAEEKIRAMREVSSEIKGLEEQLRAVEEQLEQELLQVPNLPDPTAPEGGEDMSEVIASHGDPRTFDFEPRDHVDLGAGGDTIDLERAAKVSGARFVYLKDELVFLQFALVQFALRKLATKGFRPVVPPVLVRDAAMYGTGFFPTDMQQVYHLDSDDLTRGGPPREPSRGWTWRRARERRPFRWA